MKGTDSQSTARVIRFSSIIIDLYLILVQWPFLFYLLYEAFGSHVYRFLICVARLDCCSCESETSP